MSMAERRVSRPTEDSSRLLSAWEINPGLQHYEELQAIVKSPVQLQTYREDCKSISKTTDRTNQCRQYTVKLLVLSQPWFVQGGLRALKPPWFVSRTTLCVQSTGSGLSFSSCWTYPLCLILWTIKSCCRVIHKRRWECAMWRCSDLVLAWHVANRSLPWKRHPHLWNISTMGYPRDRCSVRFFSLAIIPSRYSTRHTPTAGASSVCRWHWAIYLSVKPGDGTGLANRALCIPRNETKESANK